MMVAVHWINMQIIEVFYLIDDMENLYYLCVSLLEKCCLNRKYAFQLLGFFSIEGNKAWFYLFPLMVLMHIIVGTA